MRWCDGTQHLSLLSPLWSWGHMFVTQLYHLMVSTWPRVKQTNRKKPGITTLSRAHVDILESLTFALHEAKCPARSKEETPEGPRESENNHKSFRGKNKRKHLRAYGEKWSQNRVAPNVRRKLLYHHHQQHPRYVHQTRDSEVISISVAIGRCRLKRPSRGRVVPSTYRSAFRTVIWVNLIITTTGVLVLRRIDNRQRWFFLRQHKKAEKRRSR